MSEMISEEYGFFSPPNPLPNPQDLSNGQYGNALRFGVLDLSTEEGNKRFNLLLDWFHRAGVPINDRVFFTPVNAQGFGLPGYGATMIIFSDSFGRSCVLDATQMYNMPESALVSLLLTFNLPIIAGVLSFPGFETIELNAQPSPVGDPLPKMNTPGWSRPFARYYSTSASFNAKQYTRGDTFHKLDGDEFYVLTEIIFGFKPATTGFGMIVDKRPVWERMR